MTKVLLLCPEFSLSNMHFMRNKQLAKVLQLLITFA